MQLLQQMPRLRRIHCSRCLVVVASMATCPYRRVWSNCWSGSGSRARSSSWSRHSISTVSMATNRKRMKKEEEANLFTKLSSLFFSCFAAELPASAAERESAPGGACDQSHRSAGSSAGGQCASADSPQQCDEQCQSRSAW